MNSAQQPDLLKEPTASGASPIKLTVQGIVPSFKTQKTAYGWIDKASGKVHARPATLPEHKEWMKKTVQDFASQLRSAFQISASATRMDATLRSLIASLPRDDCWTVIAETSIKSELCAPGQEGATILIERIS